MNASPPRSTAPVTAAVPPAMRPVDASVGGRQVRKLQLASEGGREYFEAACRSAQRVVLRPLRNGNAVEYPATLAGRLDGASLLVDWPSDSDGLVPMRAGERVDVKLFSECDLLMFQVDVSLCCFRPRPYLHLDWPREIGVVGVRTVARIPMTKPAVLAIAVASEQAALKVQGTVVDLSLGGAALVSPDGGLAVGQQGTVRLSISPSSGQVTVRISPRCAIRSRRELPGGEGFQYGIQFLDPSIDDSLVLLAIVGEAALRREE